MSTIVGSRPAPPQHTGFSPAAREFLETLRRTLHRHPELSWQEFETQATLERALRDLGIERIERVARTGLVAFIPGEFNDAPAVAIRGDIDALPITEATGLPFTSENDGVMHACGHDVHASWAVGAALQLTREPARGEVRIVLQPAEEVGEGAAAVLESGILDGVAAMFGGHVDRRYEVGQVVAQAGPLSASTDTFTIVLHGQGAHGARPEESVDPVVGAAALVSAIQTIVARRISPASAAVVSVGSLHSGTASNIIPDRAALVGTIRATTVAARTQIVAELQHLAHHLAAAYRLTADVTLSEYTPPLVNSADAAAWAAEAVRERLGPGALVPLDGVNMGGEDFAFYLERMPGCFLRIGAREREGRMTPAHSPGYYPDEEALYVGADVLAHCARVASRSLAARSEKANS